MCGIAGIWNFDGQPVPQRTIDRFTDSLAHRGPDGRGVWKDDHSGIALGHRRLAILDLTDEGNQPMPYMDGRYWITYNGEVYNFLEIRKELEDKGYRFRSQSDTEVILASYHQWGPDMLVRLNGMWAFAIFDREEQKLFIARDRFGIKPFLYRLTENQFAFASELKAFKYLDGYMPEIDYESAQAFLHNGFGVEGTRRTMLRGISRLQGGHYGLLCDGKLSIIRWWNTLEHLIEPPPTFERQKEEFLGLFYEAIKLRMRSDVPVGSCLSGGFDSSAIVCTMASIGRTHDALRQAKDWQQTFVGTFPNAMNDEREEAEEVVRFAGVKGNFFPVTNAEVSKDFNKILIDFDDVYIGMPTSVWLIYRELRRANVIVSLDGHGADELMGGYKQADFLLLYNAPPWWVSPLENIRLIKQYYSILPKGTRPNGNLKALKQIARVQIANHPNFRLVYRALKTIRNLARGKESNGFLRHKPPESKGEFEMVGQNDLLPKEWGPINRELYTMFHTTILPTILRNFDRMSMAHGVEVRMPFMDWRLVRFVFSLRDASKIGDGMNKRVAREAMKGKMPESIRTSKVKVGFNSPMPEWFNGPLKSWVLNVAESKECLSHELIDGGKLSKFLHEHTNNQSWTWQNVGLAWKYLHYLWFEKEFLAE